MYAEGNVSRQLLCLLIALTCISCREQASQPVAVDGDRTQIAPNVVGVPPEDARMEAAIAEARRTTPGFLEALSGSPDTGRAFYFKMEFREGNVTEHMWVQDVAYDGKLLHGVVGNEPVDLKRVALGDPVECSPERISDWLIVSEDGAEGGFTVKALAEEE